jgi:hypothetical protein
MLPVEFEPAILAGDRQKTLDRMATGISSSGE